MFDKLWDAWGTARAAEVKRQEAEMIPAARVKNDPFPNLVSGEVFKSGGSYFGVRLAGLHMVDARQFATKQNPLCVCLAEFKQRGRDRSVPFSVGPQEIMNKLVEAGAMKEMNATPGWIELRDLTVVAPTPVGVGNLSLFVGLYSVPGDDIVKTLLNVVSDLSKTASTTVPGLQGAGAAVSLAGAVYAGFGTLIGSTTLKPLAQAQLGRALPGTGSGYLLVASAPPGVVEREELSVDEGELRRGMDLVTEFDYCLLAIERYSTILETDTQTAPDLFEEGWQEVVKTFDNQDDAAAPAKALRKLGSAIRGSPELIEADRVAVLGGYIAKYKSEVDANKAIADAMKGGADSLSTAVSTESTRARDRGENALSAQLSAIYGTLNRDWASASILTTAAEVRRAILPYGIEEPGALMDALLQSTHSQAV
jgi:hypothetical protein